MSFPGTTGQRTAQGIQSGVHRACQELFGAGDLAAMERAGFSGIGYRTHFDTGPGARGIAIFGPTGLNPFRWPSTDIVPATVLRARLTTACAITIIDTPSLASLPAAPPP
jgi:hypothetical protein